jgi:hypothetical protein
MIELGGYTPFQLKYGTSDAEYLKFPTELGTELKAIEKLKELDKNLKTIRELSLNFQMDLVAKRKIKDGPASQYESGDLVLFEQTSSTKPFLPNKLSPNFLGPFEVVGQVKNDVTCEHIVLGTTEVFHLSRLKPFFGTTQDARRVAMLDNNQFDINSINYYKGNVFKRTSLLFSVTFKGADGTKDTREIKYTDDLANTEQLQKYVETHLELYPLRFSARNGLIECNNLKKLSITSMFLNSHYYLNLRYFDGDNAEWFDSRKLPNPKKHWYVRIKVVAWKRKQLKAIAIADVFPELTLELTYLDELMFVRKHVNFSQVKVIQECDRSIYPQIWSNN